MPSFSSTKSLIPYFAKSYGFDVKILEVRVQREWIKIVGTNIASHTRPDSIKFRKLLLLVENSAWLQQLVFLKPMILEKLNAFAEESYVTDIILRIGDIRPTMLGKANTDHEIDYTVKPTASNLELASAWTVKIKEPGLRAILISAIAKGLSCGQRPPNPRPDSQL